MPPQEEEIASGKPIAKARPRPKSSAMWNSNFIPVGERKWIDIETQRSNDPQSFQVSKAITPLLRHSQKVPRGVDGAVHYDDLIEECRKKEFSDA